MTEMAEQKLKLMECATMDKEKCVFLGLFFSLWRISLLFAFLMM